MNWQPHLSNKGIQTTDMSVRTAGGGGYLKIHILILMWTASILSILIISHTTRCISQKKLAATLFGCLFIFASPVKRNLMLN
jgi:hypothetical protein